MRDWIEELSEYMTHFEEENSPLDELSVEIDQAATDAEALFAASDKLQSAYATLIGKIDHGNS